MIKVHGDSLNECVDTFIKLIPYKSYEYSGKWFIAYLNGQGYGSQYMKTLKNKALKLNIETFQVVTVGKSK